MLNIEKLSNHPDYHNQDPCTIDTLSNYLTKKEYENSSIRIQEENIFICIIY